MKKSTVYSILGIIVLAVLVWLVVLPVDETTYAIVTRFGRVVGDPIYESGLHLKYPWDSRILLDKRLQMFDPRPSEFLLVSKTTAEEKQGIGQNVIVGYFVTWRILGHYTGETAEEKNEPDRLKGPLVFLTTVNNPLNAQRKLLEIIHSEISSTLGKHDMSSLVSINPDDLKIREVEDAVTAACRAAVRKYGIEIADIRIKRVGLPEQNKQSVFDRMRAERRRRATQLRAEGQSASLTIKAQADKEASNLLAASYKESEQIKGKGDADATAIYAAAHNKDPEFYRLVRTLDAYRKFLNDKTTVVLSADSELLRILTQGVSSVLPASRPESAERPAGVSGKDAATTETAKKSAERAEKK